VIEDRGAVVDHRCGVFAAELDVPQAGFATETECAVGEQTAVLVAADEWLGVVGFAK